MREEHKQNETEEHYFDCFLRVSTCIFDIKLFKGKSKRDQLNELQSYASEIDKTKLEGCE